MGGPQRQEGAQTAHELRGGHGAVPLAGPVGRVRQRGARWRDRTSDEVGPGGFRRARGAVRAWRRLDQGHPAAARDADRAHRLRLPAHRGCWGGVGVPASGRGRVWNRVWPVVDALALGCWAATGAQKTLAVGLGWLPAVLLGTITAVGGGAVRDVVLRQLPAILGGNTLYATCAALASGALVCRLPRLPDRGVVDRAGARGGPVPARPLARLDLAQRRRVVTVPGRARPLPTAPTAEQGRRGYRHRAGEIVVGAVPHHVGHGARYCHTSSTRAWPGSTADPGSLKSAQSLGRVA